LWLSPALNGQLLVLDVEGTDGRERGENQAYHRVREREREVYMRIHADAEKHTQTQPLSHTPVCFMVPLGLKALLTWRVWGRPAGYGEEERPVLAGDGIGPASQHV
jgi:hypothetical protein